MRPCQRPSAISGAGSSADAQQHDRAMEMRAARCSSTPSSASQQFGDVRRAVAVRAGVARRNKPGRAAERIDADAGIVAKRRQSGYARRVARLQHRILDECRAGFLGIVDAEFGLRDELDAGVGQHVAHFGELAALLLARTMRRTVTIRRCPAPRAASRKARRRLSPRARASHRVLRDGTHGLRPCPAAR